jgi:hypothetical protein
VPMTDRTRKVTLQLRIPKKNLLRIIVRTVKFPRPQTNAFPAWPLVASHVGGLTQALLAAKLIPDWSPRLRLLY